MTLVLSAPTCSLLRTISSISSTSISASPLLVLSSTSTRQSELENFQSTSSRSTDGNERYVVRSAPSETLAAVLPCSLSHSVDEESPVPCQALESPQSSWDHSVGSGLEGYGTTDQEDEGDVVDGKTLMRRWEGESRST